MIEADSRFRGNDGAEIGGTTKVDETPAFPGSCQVLGSGSAGLGIRPRGGEPPGVVPGRMAGDFRSRPELDGMTGASRPSRPPGHPVVAVHGTFSGLADIAGGWCPSRQAPVRRLTGARCAAAGRW